MEEILERELRRALRKNRQLAVFMVDIDHFKRINDLFGHEVGDLVLREVAGCLRANIRQEDFACRYGGEEFVLVLPESDIEALMPRARTILEAIGRLVITHHGQPIGQVTVSIGMAAAPQHGSNVLGLVRAADQALYRAKNAFLTDSAPEVVRIRGQISNLESNVIPSLIQAQIKSLRLKEDDYNKRIQVQAGEIRGIPELTIREEELRANVEQEQKLVEYLSSNLETQRLKEASARNEVFVQDSAVAPFKPTSNTALQIIPAGVALGLALGLAFAILLDLIDKRVRYPEQVANDLRLDIIGAIPLVHPGRPSVEEQAQLVESFRTLRLSLRHQFTAGEPVSFTVTSTGPTEGKSFVSSNLALSFAEAGFRTVLVDGDTRRGAIQQAFGVPQKPGLVDYLQGSNTLDETVYPTSYERLSLVPCGSQIGRASCRERV